MDNDELNTKITMIKEQLAAGRLKLSSPDIVESLQRVRIGADGKVDPNTVDSRVRALANAVAAQRYRENLKRTPLRDVQRAYFDILERFFGQPFAEMRKHGASPPAVARQLVSSDRLVRAFQDEGKEFVTSIRNFWDDHSPVVEAHLEDLQALKSIYGGDISPSYVANIACSVGLYMDTIVLPDPLMSLGDFVGMMSTKEVLFFIAKHALNTLTYKELVLAEVEPPIVIVAPQKSLTVDSYRTALQVEGEADLVEHTAKLFGRSFSGPEEAKSFMLPFNNAEELVMSVADSGRLLFDSAWVEPPVEQIRKFTTEMGSKFPGDLSNQPVGDFVWMSLLGRMMQVNDALFRSSQFGGSPLIDAPTSWQYLLWKYEYDKRRAGRSRGSVRDVLISKVLEAQGSGELGLISGLPSEILIELRQRGALARLREIIRNGVGQINSASPTNLADVAEAVGSNLNAAFSEHKREVASLSSSKLKFFGIDVGSWIGVGAISIAAASTGRIPLAVTAAALGSLGTPSAKELWKRWQELQTKTDWLERSPTGILFCHRK